MRHLLWLLCAAALPATALAAPVEHAGTYVGWGGEGEQVFRHLVSIARNNVYSERTLIVLVDDIKRRGPRLGVMRVTVEYEGGEGASKRVLEAIHKKPYEYVLVPMYATPQTPRMARVVLPGAKGMKAIFRFYKNPRRTITGDKDKGLIPELTRTLDPAMLEELPAINPMREPSIRKPRPGQEAEQPRPTPAAIALDTEEPPPGAAPGESSPSMADVGRSGAPVSENDPRVQAARDWAAKFNAEQRAEYEPHTPSQEASLPRDGEIPPPLGVRDAPSDAPSGGFFKDLPSAEDTPEMKEAERRAEALARRLKAEQAFK